MVTEAFGQAGKEGRQLFDAADPLAGSRSLDTAKYAVDRLIEAGETYPKFISAFLLQFQGEVKING